MATPKKIIMKDLELADKEIARLRKENKKLMKNGILTQKERDKNGMDSMALQIENKELREYKENLIRADKKKTEYIEELEKENIELKEKLKEVAKELIQHHEEFKNMVDMVVELEKENKELKKKLDKLRTDNIYEEGLYD